jgi:ABC-type Fe3+/spermidine/putrescine transport system ATPase subunit
MNDVGAQQMQEVTKNAPQITRETTYIKLKKLTKRFGDILAVDEVDLDIGHGEFITLLGPSGSGKTTTLLMIAGFEMPTSGDVFIENSSILKKPHYERDVGMVFQNYSLFPHITIIDNIAFPLKMRRINKTRIEMMVDDVLELVRLSGYGSRYPRQLSGGQKQRIALAQDLIFNPSVLLMDEPLVLHPYETDGLKLATFRTKLAGAMGSGGGPEHAQ